MPVALSKNYVAVERSFPRGMVRDTQRHMIPNGGAYDLLDAFVDRPGVTYKRGGSEFQSSELTDDALLIACAAPEYPGDPRVIAIASDGASSRTLYDLTTGTAEAGVDINNAQPIENPPSVFINDTVGLASILTDGGGAGYKPQKIWLDSGVVAVNSLEGDPPVAFLSCVHLSYLVLANSVEHPNRLWFSPVPDLEATWDVDNAYIDVDHAITGLASIQGILIVFQRGESHRILGSVPPGTVGEDMDLQPLASVGCIDARSIVKMDNVVYFANEHGIYYTNGAGVESITEKDDGSGISQFWAAEMQDFAPALGALVCCGVHLNSFLLVTIRHPEGDTEQLMWYSTGNAWMRLSSSVAATMYATRFAPDSEIYAAPALLASPVRLLKLSGMFNPSSANMSDANGTEVQWQIETRALGEGPGRKHYGDAHITYLLESEEDVGIQVYEATGLNAVDYTDVQEGTPLAVTAERRARVMLSRESNALSIGLAQTGESARAEVYSIEVEYRGDPLSEDGP